MTFLATLATIWAAMEARRILFGAVMVIVILALLATLSILHADEEDGRLI